jgi:hypothetical protein
VQRAAQQREVPDDVQDLVPHELVRVAERLGGEHGVVADHDGVLEGAALDQAVLDQVLDLLEETERARVGDVAPPGFRGDLDAVKLREPARVIGARAGDLEAVVREDGDEGILRLQLDGLGDRERLPGLGLGRQARLIRALPSAMGGSLASSSTMALSMPQPAKVASTCSTVMTFTFPLLMVVERLVWVTLSMRASISGLPSRSTRRKRMPELGGAGRKVICTRLPLCRPTPAKLTGCRRVCCCATRAI